MCHRVRFERQRIAEDPDFKYKYLFLEQNDVTSFIRSIKPLLDIALQGEVQLEKLSYCLKNFISLDCDEVLSLFLFKHFRELEVLTESKFLTILNDVVPGVLVNDQDNSENKFEFIENVILYLLDLKLEVNSLKMTMEIFNCIWAMLPVLEPIVLKEMVERVSKNKDYEKYMKAMKKKRMQEYQFYRLYENLSTYAQRYFEILRTSMNLGIPLKDEIIRAFWYLFNAMQPTSYRPLVDSLLESMSEDHAKKYIGGIVSNVAARDRDTAEKVVELAVKKLVTQKDGHYELEYSNYGLIELYLTLLMSSIYQDSDVLKKYEDVVFEILKLLAARIEQENERNDVFSLVKAIGRSNVEFRIEYEGILSHEKIHSDEYLSKLWMNYNKLDTQNIKFSMKNIEESNILSYSSFLTEKLLPWAKESLKNSTEKHTLRTFSGILKEAHSNLCLLLPCKNSEEIEDFTLFYYNYIDLSQDCLKMLKNIEEEILEISDLIISSLNSSELLKRDSNVIKSTGSIFNQILSNNHPNLKGIIFTDSKPLTSLLPQSPLLNYKTSKRLLSSYISSIGLLCNVLFNLPTTAYSSSLLSPLSNAFFFEESLWAIPEAQKEARPLEEPKFVKYFLSAKEDYMQRLDAIYLQAVGLIIEFSKRNEMEVVKRDQLMGKLILLERLITKEVVENKEWVLKILLLVYTSARVGEDSVSGQVWRI